MCVCVCVCVCVGVCVCGKIFWSRQNFKMSCKNINILKHSFGLVSSENVRDTGNTEKIM